MYACASWKVSKKQRNAAGAGVTAGRRIAKISPYPIPPMNYRTALITAFAIACAASAATLASAQDAKPKNKELINFTQQSIERNGADIVTTNRYDWASGTWDKNILFLEKQGLLVNFVGGKGNMGGEKSMKLTDYDHAYLIIVIGNRNQAKSLNVGMTDGDGSEAVWSLSLAGQPVGMPLVCKMSLAKPDRFDKPGKVQGLDKAKIKKWTISGDWQDPKVEVLLVKLGAATSS